MAQHTISAADKRNANAKTRNPPADLTREGKSLAGRLRCDALSSHVDWSKPLIKSPWSLARHGLGRTGRGGRDGGETARGYFVSLWRWLAVFPAVGRTTRGLPSSEALPGAAWRRLALPGPPDVRAATLQRSRGALALYAGGNRSIPSLAASRPLPVPAVPVALPRLAVTLSLYSLEITAVP